MQDNPDSKLQSKILQFLYRKYDDSPNSYVGMAELEKAIGTSSSIISRQIDMLSQKNLVTVQWFVGGSFMVRISDIGIDLAEKDPRFSVISSGQRDLSEFLVKQFRDYIEDQLKKNLEGRKEETLTILENLSHFKSGINEERDLAREEFRGAVQRYLIGFYEDSIYHSCFSVEMGLLIRLNETLSENEKAKISFDTNQGRQPFTFGRIIRLAQEKDILGKPPMVEIAKQIMNVRNSHAHPENFIATLTIQYQRLLSQSPILKDLALKLYPNLDSILRLPSYEWCTSQKVRYSIEEDLDGYVEEMGQSMSRLDVRVLMKFFEPNYYFKRRALKTLKRSYRVLRHIELL